MTWQRRLLLFDCNTEMPGIYVYDLRLTKYWASFQE